MSEVPAKWLEDMAQIAAKKMKKDPSAAIEVAEGSNTLWRMGTPPQDPVGQVYLCFGRVLERDLPSLFVITRQEMGGWWNIQGTERARCWQCWCYQPLILPYKWEVMG
jgi:hypothetical protein